MGTGVSFRIWSPGKDREQAVRPARGKFVVGRDGSHSLSSGLLQPQIRELLVTVLLGIKTLITTVITTRESVEYMWPSVRPLVPVS